LTPAGIVLAILDQHDACYRRTTLQSLEDALALAADMHNQLMARMAARP
jgi:hypothetical protein